MFTGLVEEVGTLEQVKPTRHRGQAIAISMVIKAPRVAKDAKVGDSIAVSGCCLTVVKKVRATLTFEAGSETLLRTTFDRLKPGGQVNLERSLALGDRLGGHLVTGHIDGLASLIKRRNEGDWSHFTFRADSRLMRQVVSKGSIAVDGVSLTVVSAEDDRFSVALIPYTLTHTTLGSLQTGNPVNLETDLLAKYVERQLESREPSSGA